MSIKLKNVTVDYGDCLGVNQLSLTIESGELVSLLGPSGCGKTSTLKAISGLIHISEGQILFDDFDVTNKPPQQRNIGLVFQNYALYPHLSVAKNIAFPLRQNKNFRQAIKTYNHQLKQDYKMSKSITNSQAWKKYFLGKFKLPKKYLRSEIKQKVQIIAEKVVISEQLNKRPYELSGGQQQRVAIARAVIKTPKVLLLDEPFSNLDMQTRATTRQWIKEFQKETKITTIFVTHDQEEALSISDKVFVMNKGLLQQAGTPQEIYLKPTNRFVASFIGNPLMNFFQARINFQGIVFFQEFSLGVCSFPQWYGQNITLGIRSEHIEWNNNNNPIKETNYLFRAKLKHVEHWGRSDFIKSYFVGQEIFLIGNGHENNHYLPFFDFNFTKGKIYLFAKTNDEELIEVI